MQQRMFGALFREMFMWKLFRQFVLTATIAGHNCRFNPRKSKDKNAEQTRLQFTVFRCCFPEVFEIPGNHVFLFMNSQQVSLL